MNPKYSVCLTHFNGYLTLKQSLDSILAQIDSEFEIIVVDNISNDGSERLLKSYSEGGSIKLIEKKCSRGLGRQAAFLESKGEYVIDQIDLDDIYKPCFRDIIDFYHKNFEGRIMMMHGFLIGPRSVIASVGGWRDLQWGEDRDFWARAGAAGVLTFIPFETRSYTQPHGSGTLLKRVKYNFAMVRDLYRVGEHRKKSSWKILPILIPAYIASRFMQRYAFQATNFVISDYIPPRRKRETLEGVKGSNV